MTEIKMLYLQFYILFRAHVGSIYQIFQFFILYSADAVLYCVELFSLMLVCCCMRGRCLRATLSHLLFCHFFFHFFSLFMDVSSVIRVFYVSYVNHSPLYPYNILQSTHDVSNTVTSKSFLLKRN